MHFDHKFASDTNKCTKPYTKYKILIDKSKMLIGLGARVAARPSTVRRRETRSLAQDRTPEEPRFVRPSRGWTSVHGTVGESKMERTSTYSTCLFGVDGIGGASVDGAEHRSGRVGDGPVSGRRRLSSWSRAETEWSSNFRVSGDAGQIESGRERGRAPKA